MAKVPPRRSRDIGASPQPGTVEIHIAETGETRMAERPGRHTVRRMPDSHPAPASGTSMLVLMSLATVVLTAAIAGFCALGAWWLLPVIIASLLASAGAIVAFLFHVMDDGDHLNA